MKVRLFILVILFGIPFRANASREDDAHAAVDASHLRAHALGAALATEDFISAISRSYLLAQGIDADNMTISQMPQILEQMRTKISDRFNQIEARIKNNEISKDEQVTFQGLLDSDLASLRGVVRDFRWIQPRRNFAVELLPQLLVEIRAEIAAKCQSGRAIPDAVPMELEKALDFKCEFYFQPVDEQASSGKKTEPEVQEASTRKNSGKRQQVQGLVCSGSPSGMDSLSSGALWFQRAAGNTGPLGVGFTAVGTLLGALSALDTKAEYDRANREIIAANRIRFEGMATSLNVIESYKANCQAMSNAYDSFATGVTQKLQSTSSLQAYESAQKSLDSLQKNTIKNPDGSLVLTKLTNEQMLMLAESQILVAVTESQKVSITDEAVQRYDDLVKELNKLQLRLIALANLGQKIDSNYMQSVAQDLNSEKATLELQQSFFQMVAKTIEAVFHQELIPGVKAKLGQIKRECVSLRIKYYKDPRIHRIESGILELERILE